MMEFVRLGGCVIVCVFVRPCSACVFVRAFARTCVCFYSFVFAILFNDGCVDVW